MKNYFIFIQNGLQSCFAISFRCIQQIGTSSGDFEGCLKVKVDGGTVNIFSSGEVVSYIPDDPKKPMVSYSIEYFYNSEIISKIKSASRNDVKSEFKSKSLRCDQCKLSEFTSKSVVAVYQKIRCYGDCASEELQELFETAQDALIFIKEIYNLNNLYQDWDDAEKIEEFNHAHHQVEVGKYILRKMTVRKHNG